MKERKKLNCLTLDYWWDQEQHQTTIITMDRGIKEVHRVAVLNASEKETCSLVMTSNSAVIGAKRETSPQIDSAERAR